MTFAIILAVIAGVLAGCSVMPAVFIENTGPVLTAGLCLLLFLVGIDIGRQGTVLKDIRQNGFRILAVPFLVIAGTFAGSAVAAVMTDLSPLDSAAVASGFGWYTLAPVIISEYSAELGAISFLAHVMREIFASICIPFVAKYVGYIESCAPAGAAAMDTCLPVTERSAGSTTAVYSFVSGFVLTCIIPVLVPMIMNLR